MTRLSALLRKALMVLLWLAPGGGLFLASAQGPAPRPTSVRQADAACAKCHQAIYATYMRTPKANASGLAADHFVPGSFTQASSGTTYQVGSTQGNAWLQYRRVPEAALHGEHPLDYFLGSGHLGITYLYSEDHYLFESPVAWYRVTDRYDMKPGLKELKESAPAIPAEASCLRCHMSGVQPADTGSLNRYSGLPFLHGGITCESCHGDTSAHLQSAGRIPTIDPARLAPRLRDSICISCHLEGDAAVEKNGRSALDFKPGEDIGDYLAFFVYADANPNARGVSEVEQFASSHCRRASGEAMSCTSCHDPHFAPASEDRAAYYRGKCLACHSAGHFAARHHPENQDCTACHMPRNTAENIPHVAWTDHRILAQPALARAGSSPQFDTMLPVFSPSAAPRDHALALYAAMNDGHMQSGPQAFAQLKAAFQDNGKDVQVLSALATLYNMQGESTQAASLFEAVLAIEPHNRIAAVNLAILRARAGDLQQARTLLDAVFERNQDLPAIAMNLAAIACRQGDAAAAREALQKALRYNPGSQELQARLQQASSCTASPAQ